MVIEIQTQVRENYGAHAWDGKGECPQYWKNKGGEAYLITDVPEGVDVESLVDRAVRKLEIHRDDNFFQEYVIDTRVCPDGHQTYDELDQLEFSGKITYPSTRTNFNDL